MTSKNAPVRTMPDGTRCWTKECKLHTVDNKLTGSERSALTQWLALGELPVSVREVVVYVHGTPAVVSDEIVQAIFDYMTEDEITSAYLAVKAAKDNARMGRKKVMR